MGVEIYDHGLSILECQATSKMSLVWGLIVESGLTLEGLFEERWVVCPTSGTLPTYAKTE